MSLSPALEQLAELVRRTEAQSRLQELNDQIEIAAEQLRTAEARIQAVEGRAREVRPTRLRELEQIETDEHLFKELVRKTAQNRTLFSPEALSQAEQLIETSRADLESRRVAAQSELEEIAREQETARHDVRVALERYQQLKRELERLQLKPNGQWLETERLAHVAETYFPEYQVRAFAREIDDGASMFGMLDRREQYAQMKIWIGRLRRFQANEPAEEERELLEQVFRRLVGLSKQYEPGYIEAFNRQFSADWDLYVSEAQEALKLASEDVRRGREQQGRLAEIQQRDHEQRRQARMTAMEALRRLKSIVLAPLPNEEEQEKRFRETLRDVVDGYGSPDDELLDLVRPHREWLIGSEFRNLRRYLDQEEEEENREREFEETREQYQDILEITKGARAIMIGGAVREEARRQLLRAFEFDSLEWVPYQDNKPVLLDSLEQRVRNQNVDVVILLLNFIGHHVSNTFRPLCKEVGIPCAMVERGYGAAQIAESLRRGLPREE